MNPSGTCASNRHVSTLLAYQMVPADSFSAVRAASRARDENGDTAASEKRRKNGENVEPKTTVGEHTRNRSFFQSRPVERQKWDKFAEAESNPAES